MRKKKRRSALGCACLLIICFSLGSCGLKEKTPGLHETVVVENASVEVIDFFGDAENTYIVAELLLSEHDSVYDGQLSSLIVSAPKMQGGYAFYCVGRDEIEHTQTYLICIGARAKGEIGLTFINYRSVINPMNRIVEGEWRFSIDSGEMKSPNETIIIENATLKHIKLFDNAMIVLPSANISLEEFRAYRVAAFNATGEELFAAVNSMSEEHCHFEFAFLRFDKQEELKKITINDIDYFIDSKG